MKPLSNNNGAEHSHSPARLLLILAAAIFAAETLIMLVFHLWLPVTAWLEALLDSTLLLLMLFPVLFFFMFRPLAREIAERGEAQEALALAHEQLEERIRERTAELEHANAALQAEIVERRRAENRLQEAELRYRTLFEESPDGVLTIDPETMLPVEFNATAHRQLGYSREEFAALRISDYEAAENPEEIAAHIERILRNGQGTFETRHRTRSGEIRNVLVTVQNIILSGRHLFHSIFRDITESKRMEEALQQATRQLTGRVTELEMRNREINLLSEMVDLFQASRTTEEAYAVIADHAPQLFPDESGALYTLNASRNTLEAAVTWGGSPPSDPAFAPSDCWALRRGKTHLLEGSRLAMICPHLGKSAPIACLCVPMMAQGEALGVLTLRCISGGDVECRSYFTADVQRLAVTAAEHLALALANLRLRETLRHQAIRDPLTGLFNRRYMEETLEREINRAERRNAPLGILMLDLDHFKRFNDDFGHDAGDSLLREFGRFLLAGARREDIACRYGGEEFVLILPETSLETMRQRAEELRAGARHLSAPHRGQSLGGVTLSVGVAVFPQHGATAEELLRVSDRALYRAKAEGRDRVAVGEKG